MSFPPLFLLQPVVVPEHIPRGDSSSLLTVPSSPPASLLQQDSNESLPTSHGLRSSPSVIFRIRSSSMRKLKGIFRSSSNSHMNSSPPSSSPLQQLMEVDSVPCTPTRAARTTDLPIITQNNAEFHGLLESVIYGISTDYVTGTRQIASSALSNLATLMQLAADTSYDKEDLWDMTVGAAKKMAIARPAMSASITPCLLRGLVEIDQEWGKFPCGKTPTDLARIGEWVIQEMLKEREQAGLRIGQSFTFWVKTCGLESHTTTPERNSEPLRILTIGNSGTIYTAILTLLLHSPCTYLDLTILESRPRFEGADLTTNLLAAAATKDADSRLHIRVAPDCAVASIVRYIDIVLLGADRISAEGDVCHKMGSLAAVICAKTLQPECKVLVLSDGDKIAGPNTRMSLPESHHPSVITNAWSDWQKEAMEEVQDKVDVVGECFEWVSKDLIDFYLTEDGPLNVKEVKKFSEDVAALESVLFG